MSLTERLYKLFLGNGRAHGVFNVTKDRDRDGKKQGYARVIQEHTTPEHWDKHISGDAGLGIIPIKDNNHCHWGAIDVDNYNIDHRVLIEKLKKHKFPAVVCRSKSGGAHIYFFFSEEISAAELQPKLAEISSVLGHSGCEIFPKQTEILVERGDTGNFINMPYFGGENTVRYAFGPNGDSLTLEEFITFAEDSQMTVDEFLALETKHKKSEELLPHGPPCLQHLCSQGFGEGGRNNALFSLGVYARRAHKDEWENVVQQYNMKYMKPPLSANEVATIIKQLQKKDYFYKCDDQPISSFCNKDVCMTRKFGVGPGSRNNDLSSLTKIAGDPPIWLLNVDGQRVELSTDALVSQSAFQKECVSQINKFPLKMTDRAWQIRMQELLENITVVETAPDTTLKGTFEDLLASFCCDRARGFEKEEIVQGIAVWMDGRIYFQIKDLVKHLTVNNFLNYSVNKVGLRLRELGGERIFWSVGGKGTHVWHFAQGHFGDAAKNKSIGLPPVPKPKKDVM
jgi:hypothetical protein